jgi:hypothetical protein
LSASAILGLRPVDGGLAVGEIWTGMGRIVGKSSVAKSSFKG